MACELAVPMNFVDPRHEIIALHLCYRACDTDAVANIHGGFYSLPPIAPFYAISGRNR